MRQLLVTVFALLAMPVQAHFMGVENGCQNPDFAELGKSVVSISLYYDQPKPGQPIGKRGTAVFVSDTELLTIEHIASDSFGSEYSEVEFSWGTVVRKPVKYHETLPIRLKGYVETGSERIAVLELRYPFANFAPIPIRASPLKKDEPVVAVGYGGDQGAVLQHGVGHFSPLEPSKDGEPSEEPHKPGLYFEFTNETGHNRTVFDEGASGSPVFDCDGYLVAVLSDILTNNSPAAKKLKKMRESFGQQGRIPPDWGNPTNIGVATTGYVID